MQDRMGHAKLWGQCKKYDSLVRARCPCFFQLSVFYVPILDLSLFFLLQSISFFFLCIHINIKNK
jgi:hypothetical protein